MTPLTPEQIVDYLNTFLGEPELELQRGAAGQPWIQLRAELLPALCLRLRDHEALQFDSLMCLTGLHYDKEQELGVVYNLHSTVHGHKINLKVRVPESNPHVPSVERIWKTADWHEREAWDMVGVVFDNHPNLQRILTPDDWEGHPLRKDYVQQEFYQGIPTT